MKSRKIKVKIFDRLYLMTYKQFMGVVGISKEQVPFGIYAIMKNNYAEMLNVKCSSKSQLRNCINEYKQQGFKVYSNGL